MNMNRKNTFFICLIIALLLIPTINAQANERAIRSTCRCQYENGILQCSRNNCTTSILERDLQNKCGENGTVSRITFECDGTSGTDPENACRNHLNAFTGNLPPSVMTVRADATCSAGAAVRLADNFCEDVASTMRFLGYIIFFVKILIPFVIIIMGTIDFYKAVVSSKGDDLQKEGKTFFKRLLAGVIIFFIPTILNMGLIFIQDWSSVADEYEACAICLLTPSECEVNSPVPGQP